MDKQIDKIIDAVTAPFFGGMTENNDPDSVLKLLKETQDFQVSGRDLFQSDRLKGQQEILQSIVKEEDTLIKTGCDLSFKIHGDRAFKLPGSSIPLKISAPFSLEIRKGKEPFSDPEVTQRFQKDLVSLKEHLDFSPDQVLAAGILPQTKKLLAINTPFSAEVMGFRICLRFLAAVHKSPKIRLFAIGPMIKEIMI